jgi:hypothetical protein
LRISKLWAILASALFLLSTPARSFADQFDILYLTTDNRTFLGLSSNGTAYFDYSPTGLSYAYAGGVMTNASSAAPAFTSDNGTPCAPTAPAGTYFVSGVCNNGLDAFSARPNSGPDTSLYWGAGSQIIFGPSLGPLSPTIGPIFMNGLGDIVFDDLANDNWYEAIDLTTAPTPAAEPASLLLLATGILAPIFFFRRRRTV